MLDRRAAAFFRSLSAGAFWRLFIDYNRQAEVGPMGFDNREPGYLESMFRGFEFMLSTIGCQITPEYLFELHRASIMMAQTKLIAAVGGVSDDGEEKVTEVYQPFDLSLSTEFVSFGLVINGATQNVTRNGLRELLEKLAAGADFFAIQSWDVATLLIDKDHVSRPITDKYVEEVFLKLGDAAHACQVMLSRRTNQVLIGMINQILSNYYKKIETTDDKVREIVILVHELELLHPFDDANCRTIVMLLLNKLLIEQELSPTVLTNPNRFDVFSIDELCKEVKDGMTRFAGLSAAEYAGAEPALYINGNLSVCELLIREMCGVCQHWDLVKESERVHAYGVIQSVLSSVQRPLTTQQIVGIAEIVRGGLDLAIYKKSALQKMLPHNLRFFAGESIDYGVHFGAGEKEFDGGKLQKMIAEKYPELFVSSPGAQSSASFSHVELSC